MVRLRLTRTGRAHLPTYRLVAINKPNARDSRAIEFLGSYSTITKEIKFDKERIEYWLSVGAKPSETVERLLIKEKILKAPKHKKVYTKTPGKKSVERAEAKAEKEAEAKEAKAEKKAEAAE